MQVDIGDYFIIGVDKCNIPLWDCNRGSGYAFHCYKIAKVIHKGDEQSPYPNMNAVIQYSTNDPEDKVSWTIPLFYCKDRANWPIHISKRFASEAFVGDSEYNVFQFEECYQMGKELAGCYKDLQRYLASPENLGFDITSPIAEESFVSYFNEAIPDKKIQDIINKQESKIRRTMREWPYGSGLTYILHREDQDDKLSTTYTYKWFWKKDV